MIRCMVIHVVTQSSVVLFHLGLRVTAHTLSISSLSPLDLSVFITFCPFVYRLACQYPLPHSGPTNKRAKKPQPIITGQCSLQRSEKTCKSHRLIFPNVVVPSIILAKIRSPAPLLHIHTFAALHTYTVSLDISRCSLGGWSLLCI